MTGEVGIYQCISMGQHFSCFKEERRQRNEHCRIRKYFFFLIRFFRKENFLKRLFGGT
jgi:hypothetical protein